jgi:hypothetical protein
MTVDPELLRRLIQAERERYAEGGTDAPGAIPPDDWTLLPDEGHRAHFTEEEVARAGELFLSPVAARAFALDLYSESDPGAGIFFPEEMLSALSLLSADVAERVRLLLRESPEEAQRRVECFRRRVAFWQANGSPPDSFPS